MAYTPNYNFYKPSQSEQYDIEHQNSNMDLIDTALQQSTGEVADLIQYVGDLANLTTDEKSNIVGALNEIDQNLASHSADYVTQGDNPHGLIYEEGTWVPKLTFSIMSGEHTYTRQDGRYIRMGNIVHIEATLTLSFKDPNSSGVATITGLPFVNIGPNAAASIAWFDGVSLGSRTFVGFSADYTRLTSETSGSDVNRGNISSGAVSDNFAVRLSITLLI
mgnify:CR=1 FL=1